MSELIDNRAHRIRTLKEIITRLHRGEAPQAVRPQLVALVRECDAGEIAAMEQELMADGMQVSEIMRMCDLHADALRDIIVDRTPRDVPAGHPVDTFRRENRALGDTAARLRAAIGLLTLGRRDDEPVDATRLGECRALFNQLMDVDTHYQRKENLLFPFLERYGITGPSKVMWGKDDEVRAALRGLNEVLSERRATVGEWRVVAPTVALPALDALEEMIFKEEKILLPMALQTLTDADWGEIWQQSPAIGWCIVDPSDDWRPPTTVTPASEAARAIADRDGVAFETPASRIGPAASGALVFPTGSLTLEQLKVIFGTLPVDLTFVDADDRVRFFTEGGERVFARPRAIIGRKVQHCHPPSSVDVVERILGDFREGRQNVAEFWIDLRAQFVHIRYFAVRDDRGTYQGTLEVTQNLTRERALEGERRLLQYD